MALISDFLKLPVNILQAYVQGYERLLNKGARGEAIGQDRQSILGSQGEVGRREELLERSMSDILRNVKPELPGVSSLLGGQQANVPLPGLSGDSLQDTDIQQKAVQQLLLNRPRQSLPDIKTAEGFQMLLQSGLLNDLSNPSATAEDAFDKIFRRSGTALNIKFKEEEGERSRAGSSGRQETRLESDIEQKEIDRRLAREKEERARKEKDDAPGFNFLTPKELEAVNKTLGAPKDFDKIEKEGRKLDQKSIKEILENKNFKALTDQAKREYLKKRNLDTKQFKNVF